MLREEQSDPIHEHQVLREEPSGPIHEHHGFFERILHHGSHSKSKGKENDLGHESEAKDPQQPQKTESEMDKFKDDLTEHENKFKDYIKKDEEADEDGHTYADLM